MSLVFWVNQIFKDMQTNKFYRILWISDNESFLFVVDIYSVKLNIKRFGIKELEEGFQTDKIAYINEDPFDIIVPDIADKVFKKFDLKTAIEIVSYITCLENEPDVYYNAKRRKLILEAKEKYKKSDVTIYKYLKSYWQGGMKQNALYPLYSNCGNKGVRKNQTSSKLGRPNRLSYLNKNEIGVNLTDRDKEIFRSRIKVYYKKHDVSLQNIFNDIKEAFYSDTVVENGVKKRIVRPQHTFPTFGQFRNFYYNEMREKNPIETMKDKVGEVKFLKDKRGLTSTSRQEVFGPGFTYQIDSTRYNVALRNRVSRKHNVGHPTVYLIPDVATSLIAGVYVGLEAPSKSSVAFALYNMVEDKVEFCKRFGIDISSDKWPNTPLPRFLLADNAELAGIMPENAIKNLMMSVDNTPSRRPDLKAIVEELFYQIELKLRIYVPGMGVGNYKLRGEKDVRLDANLNIEEFTNIVLLAVIHHNNNIITQFKPSDDMMSEEILPIPVDMWNYGVKKYSGKPKKPNLNDVKLNLMYSGTAKVTKRGINFIDMLYECDLAEGDEWFFRAKNFGEWEVDIRYDRTNLTYIYIINEDAKRYELCKLKKENLFYAGMSYDEIVACKDDYGILKMRAQDRLNQNDVDMAYGMKSTIKNAIRDNKIKNGGSMATKKNAMKDVKFYHDIESKSFQKESTLNIDGTEGIIPSSVYNNEYSNNDELLDEIISFSARGNE